MTRFFVDLLFFHVEQVRYVVVELKVGKFKPEYAGQLGFYVELIEDRTTVWSGTRSRPAASRFWRAEPAAIASYDLLPPEEQAALPSRQR